jgi:Ca-activated chloride channel family protein
VRKRKAEKKMTIEFAHPLWFLLVIPWLLLIIWHFGYNHRHRSKFNFPETAAMQKMGTIFQRALLQLPFALKLIGLLLLIIAMARPRHGISEKEIITEGIDIVIAMDVSTSMKAEDFRPNRLEAAKDVAKSFLEGRKSDRIGLVIYAGEAFSQAPLTLDYSILHQSIEAMDFADEGWDGTAIGMGIATGVNRLKDSEATNKVMILLTDGENNRGQIDPLTAANLCADFGIRVYTIGVGTRGMAPLRMRDPFTGRQVKRNVRVNIDEDLLRDIAAKTNGRYFRATNNKSLEQIFEEINTLEKSKIEVKEYTNFSEKFTWFLWPGLLAILMGVFLERTWLMRIP